ncbi:MAG TPA: AI-2E family transporter YdiK, partial [Syntrophorhabdales bacterium]|nr:AI-2E family transporter YdiK [Syntrophorhabdales bacterium]
MTSKGTPAARDITGAVLAVLFIGVLITASFWILRPFLTSIVWATMIVVATWPILLWLQARLRNRRGLAVAVMTVLILLVVVVPFLLAVATIIDKADDIADRVNALTTFRPPPPPEWVGNIPLVGQKIADSWQHITTLREEELAAQLTPLARKAVGWFAAQAGSVAVMILQFFFVVIISAILYAKGETAAAGVRKFARRLAGQNGEEAVLLAAKAIRGVALGIVVTALIQSAIGAIGLVVTGVPVVVLLTAVMFILCLAQVGPGLVLVPAVIWLYWVHGGLWGTLLLVFTVIAATVDNFIRPVLIRKGADLSLVLI